MEISKYLMTSQERIKKSHEIKVLEEEWAKYKYLILEYSPRHYQMIRQLLKDKTAYPAKQFMQALKQAVVEQPTLSQRVNAYDHVWGHLKKMATSEEELEYQQLKIDLLETQTQQETDEFIYQIKTFLKDLAEKYGESYLLHSYFFLSEK